MQATPDATPPLPPSRLSPAPGVRAPGLLTALGLIVLYFLLQATVGALIAFALGLWMGLRAGLQHLAYDAKTIGHQVQITLAQPDARAVMVMLVLCVAAGSMLWLTHRRWPRLWSLASPPGFAVARPAQPLFYLLAIVIGLAAPVLGGWLTQWLAHGHKVPQDIQRVGAEAALPLRVALMVIVVTVGPLVEELLFRGVLLSALLRRLPAGWAVAACSLLFALVHLPDLGFLWYALPGLALLAAALAWLRLRSGSIWPAVLAHGANNLVAVAAWFLAVKPTG
jgi:membrane protease YdiL (CAAX protease family)